MGDLTQAGVGLLLGLLVSGCASSPGQTTTPAVSVSAAAASPSATPMDTAGAFAGPVDIGGHSVWVTCTEPVAGGPTVILEHGGQASHAVWSNVIPEIADVVRVCAYDRAGDGRSDPIGPHTANDLADDLHTLIGAAHIETPVLLTGHSVAGLMMRVFADRYPNDVAGMVFLDPLVPYVEELQLAALPAATEDEPQPVTRYRDLLHSLIAENDVALPEYDNFLFNASYAQAQAVAELEGLPVMVVTAERDDWLGDAGEDPVVRAVDATLMGVQLDAHRVLAGLSSAGEHRTVASGHEIPRDHPEVVVDAILDMVRLSSATGEPATADAAVS